jgi:hypothetical protein
MVLATVAAPNPEPPQLNLIGMSAQSPDVDTAGTPVGDRWTAGFRWAPQACGRVSGVNDCGTLHRVDYRTNGNPGIRTHQPTVIEVEYVCSTLGWDWDYYVAQATALMIAGEPVAAEKELWDGALARSATGLGQFDSNLWLTKHGVATDITPTVGTAVKPKYGLALLEQFLGDTGFGSRGMIHIPRELTPHLGVRVDGSNLLSNLNTLVVPGVGYSGRGPAPSDGAAGVVPSAGTAWAYATGRVTYRHSDIVLNPETPAQAVDRSVNTVRITASRYSAATWDLCATAAILISTVDV